ncbi:hypothetical protein [Desulfosporosinus sp.]|uniref:hypothetical protein n=1 Tax=Desulfosporosinus sp. TaxID=157907 RepID=UPI0025BAF431|nr:hypothetical protein [Desulfosporosinus sp.]MBC2725120.1 hypothetical protein [Desulfosporosinus sp.]
MDKTKRTTLKVMLFIVSIIFCLLPTNLLASTPYTASPLVKIGKNPNYNNSAGLFIGIQGIKNQLGEPVQGINLGAYQIEIDYNPAIVTILDVRDEAEMDNFTKSIVDVESKAYIAGATDSEPVNYDSLVFVPLVVNGSVKDLTDLTIRFIGVVDTDLNEVSIPEYHLNLQRGKVVNQATSGDPSISDALAGLQYLGNNRAPGVDEGQVNLINMGSINPLENQVGIVEPNVKDIISLMQYLVHTRNDYFEQVTPQANDLAITSVSALTNDGRVLSIEFNKAISSVNKSEVKIVNSTTLARIGVESVELSHDGKTLEVNLYDNPTAGNFVIEYLTDYTVTVKNLSFTFLRPAFNYGRIRDIDVNNRTISMNGLTFTIPTSTTFDFQASLGAKVRVWYNRNYEARNILFENETTVTGKLDVIKTHNPYENGKVTVDGVEYDLSNNLVFYNNDYSNPIGSEGTEYDYAKVFLDTSGKIEFISSYNFDDLFIVKSTEGNVAISYDNGELDLEDFIIVKDGKTISVSDLNQDDIVFFETSSNDGDGIAEVYNNSVTGVIETVYSDRIKIGGINYNWDGRFGSARYLDGNEFDCFDTDKAEAFQSGGPVTAYLNRYGEIVYLIGTGPTLNLNTLSAYNVENITAYIESGIPDGGTLDIELLNEDGINVTKSLRVNTLDKVTVTTPAGNSMVYEANDYYPRSTIEIAEFALADTGSSTFEIVALDSNHLQIGEGIKGLTPDNTADTVIRYTFDDSGTIIGLEFLTSRPLMAPLELDDDYVTAGNKYRLQPNTVVYDASNENISISTWSELASNDYNILEADIYTDEDYYVEYLVIKQTGIRQPASQITDYNAVLTSVLRNPDDEVVEIKALVNGTENTYLVNNIWRSICKGQSVVLSINNASGLVEDIITPTPEELFTGVVVGIDVADRTIIVNGLQFKLISSGYVYNAMDISAITVEPFRTIDLGDTVEILLDEEGTFYAEVITIIDSF